MFSYRTFRSILFLDYGLVEQTKILCQALCRDSLEKILNVEYLEWLFKSESPLWASEARNLGLFSVQKITNIRRREYYWRGVNCCW